MAKSAKTTPPGEKTTKYAVASNSRYTVNVEVEGFNTQKEAFDFILDRVRPHIESGLMTVVFDPGFNGSLDVRMYEPHALIDEDNWIGGYALRPV